MPLELISELIFYFILSFFIIFMVSLPIGIIRIKDNIHNTYSYKCHFTKKAIITSIISLFISITLIVKYG